MQNRIKDFFAGALRMPVIPLLAVFAGAAVGVANAIDSSMLESAFAIWLFGVAVFVPYYFSRKDFGPEYRTNASRAAGIALLLASMILIWMGKNNSAVMLLVLAVTLFFGNFKIMFLAFIPVLFWTAVIPKTELIHFYLSYPMRIIGADISAAALRLFGFDAAASTTIVTIGGRDIAVTAACSGIDQLEAMLFVGWVIAVSMHAKTWERLAHFVLVLPIILLVNAIRLTITLGGTEKFGDAFLSDEVHTALGFGSVVLIALIFVGIGSLFSQGKKTEEIK